MYIFFNWRFMKLCSHIVVFPVLWPVYLKKYNFVSFTLSNTLKVICSWSLYPDLQHVLLQEDSFVDSDNSFSVYMFSFKCRKTFKIAYLYKVSRRSIVSYLFFKYINTILFQHKAKDIRLSHQNFIILA